MSASKFEFPEFGHAQIPGLYTPEVADRTAWQALGNERGYYYVDDIHDEEVEPIGWRYEEWEQIERDERRAKFGLFEGLAAKYAELDYYTRVIHDRPKYDIGRYVARQGIPVPLIEDDDAEAWQKAKDEGKAFIRSEQQQDYNGLQGVFDSYLVEPPSSIHRPQHNLALWGLYTDQLNEKDFMEMVAWDRNRASYFGAAADIELPAHRFDIDQYTWPEFSHWRYLDGLQVRLFRDPVVNGRYHFGTRSWGHNSSKSSGYVEADQHDLAIQGRYYDQQPLPARQVIELYETVRALPRFDRTNAPFMELLFDEEGEIHFLQYYKTRQQVAPADPFPLPSGPTFDYVRGATLPEGLSRRLYIEPNRIDRGVIGQAVYLGLINMHNRSHAGSMISQLVDVLVHDGDLSLRESHTVSSLLYGPKEVSVCSYGSEAGKQLHRLEDEIHESRRFKSSKALRDEPNAYITMHLTSNGHQAIIESDYKLQYDEV